MGLPDTINYLKTKTNSFLLPDAIAAIYLYGSIIEDKLRVDSDIDIAILPGYNVNELEIPGLISKIEGFFTSLLKKRGFQQEVSILNLRDKYVSLQLLYKVITKGKLIYERDFSERVEFENTLKREYFDFEPYLRYLRMIKYGDLPQKV